ncbi:hybrid sensor histidine kinase/response regulator [Sphingomicrobium sediminis]|uniref:histidine kinase n=1 Tax=Sphingomicrobium sediminis TaxID=2950949 RepID=A0A9X2J1P8_9SPHN|nr:response regulator [Sphingomicrobium sediminis]MCM8556944.1 response regulator [Sphingomicrobium sediminis]
MLDRHAALVDPGPLDTSLKWLGPGLVGAVVVTLALLLAGDARWPLALALLAGGVISIAAWRFWRGPAPSDAASLAAQPATPNEEFALAAAALQLAEDAAAITDSRGQVLLANRQYGRRFEASDPLQGLGDAEEDGHPLALAREAALRSGQAELRADGDKDSLDYVVRRVGTGGETLLLWSFCERAAPDHLEVVAGRIGGDTGTRLAAAGVLAATLDDEGNVIASNPLFAERILVGVRGKAPALTTILSQSEDGLLRIIAEGDQSPSLRGVHVPIDPLKDDGAGTLLLFDASELSGVTASENVQVLLELLPLGLALVDRDGRFLTMNRAFRQAGGIDQDKMPSYPGDLVVKEDKAAVADAVRRNSRGPAMSADIAVRLARNPKEPVALTVAGLRGIGDAAVLLLLKDNSEEAKLKRQIAQATKMQAVGQLAGGVAHDFNNILTAILGHCDLMLMRHTPGDSDYDDIQQIKSNSNRAAGLTRQLLAFSRQQTLRPQVLQLADVVAEVSHLLKRLLGETVELKVKHGRDVGLVRADPGQLEQVIVNLAVNARDAMLDNGGGTLTIQTYSVRAEQVADLGSEILPVADYSALSITDTGSGIPPAVLGKIFEPFFTTKEVGKGTGLGLSTVYGIVKQSGGFIFADSKVGKGTSFVIYLPVHEVAEEDKARPAGKAPDESSELWGSGTILLVEDEPMVRTVAERALARHGYTVLTANNGEEALELLEDADEVSLLVSDVVMPLMDGPTMGREARKDRPDLPILFMSGYAEEQLRKSIDIDNVDFLPKPFSVQELAEAVRKVLADK